MLTESGSPIQAPAEDAAILQMAACCALCNDSTLTYNSGALRSCIHCTGGQACLSASHIRSTQCHQLLLENDLLCNYAIRIEEDANDEVMASRHRAPAALVPV